MKISTYLFTVLFVFLILLPGCADNGDQAAKSEQSQFYSTNNSETDMPQIDLTDYETLTETYLNQPFFAGVTADVWTDAFNIDSEALVNFYAIHWMKETKSDGADFRFPTKDVDKYLKQYFDISDLDVIRYSVWYDEKKDVYWSEGLGDGGSARVVKAELDDDILKLTYNVYSPAYDTTVVWDGVLTIRLEENGFKYVENFMEYPEYPITKDHAYLDNLTATYVYPLMPAYGIAWTEWESPMDIPATSLIHFCAFNNLLNRPLGSDGEYLDNKAPAAEVEAAVKDYFDVSAEYLRTADQYNYVNESTGKKYDNAYLLPYGYGGGGGTLALDAEQNGDLLVITVGLFGPDDAPTRPYKTTSLTIRKIGENKFHYLSNRL